MTGAAMSDEWEPPRCIHGKIILGCPHDDCPTQNAYLDQQRAAMRDYEQRQRQAPAFRWTTDDELDDHETAERQCRRTLKKLAKER